jgi:hypothetical protein
MFAIGVVAINYGSRMLNLNWMMSFVIMVATSVLWAFVSGTISIKAIFRILKYG